MVMINTFLYLYDEINKTVIMSKIDTFLIDETLCRPNWKSQQFISDETSKWGDFNSLTLSFNLVFKWFNAKMHFTDLYNLCNGIYMKTITVTLCSFLPNAFVGKFFEGNLLERQWIYMTEQAPFYNHFLFI